MRNFYYRLVKNMVSLYMCLVLVLTYRLVYNRFYFDIREEISVSNYKEKEVYPSGQIVGIYTKCAGVFVIDTCEIESNSGEFVNIVENKIKKGDYILSINGKKLEKKEDMINAVKHSEGSKLELLIVRDNQEHIVELTPILAKSGEYMLGIWVKDDLAGVGTITYVTQEGDFGALGHGMGDGETQNLLTMNGGDLYISNIVGIEKGKRGNPGEIKGVIYYGKNNHIGELDENTGRGIYGKIDEEKLYQYRKNTELVKIANKQEVQQGDAKIMSEVSGELEIYDIEITYIDYLALDSNKGIHIKVTDPDLIDLTGGIVQGMSGSPILQNGKLIGAVTHVLINDPGQGYGIFADEMLLE